MNVVAVARNQDKLNELVSKFSNELKVLTIQANVTQKHAIDDAVTTS